MLDYTKRSADPRTLIKMNVNPPLHPSLPFRYCHAQQSLAYLRTHSREGPLKAVTDFGEGLV